MDEPTQSDPMPGPAHDPDPPEAPDESAEPAPPGPRDQVSGATLDPSDPTAPVFDAAGDPLPAGSFAPGLDDAALGFSPAGTRPVACGWCGTVLADEAATTCPTCGAALQPQQELPEIPGVNVAPLDVRRAVRTVNPEILALVTPPLADDIARPGTRPSLDPPSTSIRRVMLELEIEAQRAAATVAPAVGPATVAEDAQPVPDARATEGRPAAPTAPVHPSAAGDDPASDGGTEPPPSSAP